MLTFIWWPTFSVWERDPLTSNETVSLWRKTLLFFFCSFPIPFETPKFSGGFRTNTHINTNRRGHSKLKILINTKYLSLSMQSTRLNMHEITRHYIVKPLPKTLGNFSQSLPVISPIHQWDKSPRFWHLRCYNQSKRFFHLWHKWFQQQPQLTLADVHNRTRGWTHHGLFWHLTDSVYHILWLVWSNRGGLASFSPHVLSCPHIATYPCNLWNRAGHGWNRVGYVKTIRYVQQDYQISTSFHYKIKQTICCSLSLYWFNCNEYKDKEHWTQLSPTQDLIFMAGKPSSIWETVSLTTLKHIAHTAV